MIKLARIKELNINIVDRVILYLNDSVKIIIFWIKSSILIDICSFVSFIETFLIQLSFTC